MSNSGDEDDYSNIDDQFLFFIIFPIFFSSSSSSSPSSLSSSSNSKIENYNSKRKKNCSFPEIQEYVKSAAGNAQKVLETSIVESPPDIHLQSVPLQVR